MPAFGGPVLHQPAGHNRHFSDAQSEALLSGLELPAAGKPAKSAIEDLGQRSEHTISVSSRTLAALSIGNTMQVDDTSSRVPFTPKTVSPSFKRGVHYARK